MSLTEATKEHLCNKNIKQVVFDYILTIYFVNQRCIKQVVTKIYFLLRNHSIFIISPSYVMWRIYLVSGHDHFLPVLINPICVTSSLYTQLLTLYIRTVSKCTKHININPLAPELFL